MAITYNVSLAQITSAVVIGYLPIEVSTGVGAASLGFVNSATDLATKLRQGGLPASFQGVISFGYKMGVDATSLAAVANQLREAGWSAARYQAGYSITGAAHHGPLASAALRSLGARAFAGDGSVMPGGASSGPQSQSLYIHERVHQL